MGAWRRMVIFIGDGPEESVAEVFPYTFLWLGR